MRSRVGAFVEKQAVYRKFQECWNYELLAGSLDN